MIDSGEFLKKIVKIDKYRKNVDFWKKILNLSLKIFEELLDNVTDSWMGLLENLKITELNILFDEEFVKEFMMKTENSYENQYLTLVYLKIFRIIIDCYQQDVILEILDRIILSMDNKNPEIINCVLQNFSDYIFKFSRNNLIQLVFIEKFCRLFFDKNPKLKISSLKISLKYFDFFEERKKIYVSKQINELLIYNNNKEVSQFLSLNFYSIFDKIYTTLNSENINLDFYKKYFLNLRFSKENAKNYIFNLPALLKNYNFIFKENLKEYWKFFKENEDFKISIYFMKTFLDIIKLQNNLNSEISFKLNPLICLNNVLNLTTDSKNISIYLKNLIETLEDFYKYEKLVQKENFDILIKNIFEKLKIVLNWRLRLKFLKKIEKIILKKHKNKKYKFNLFCWYKEIILNNLSITNHTINIFIIDSLIKMIKNINSLKYIIEIFKGLNHIIKINNNKINIFFVNFTEKAFNEFSSNILKCCLIPLWFEFGFIETYIEKQKDVLKKIMWLYNIKNFNTNKILKQLLKGLKIKKIKSIEGFSDKKLKNDYLNKIKSNNLKEKEILNINVF